VLSCSAEQSCLIRYVAGALAGPGRCLRACNAWCYVRGSGVTAATHIQVLSICLLACTCCLLHAVGEWAMSQESAVILAVSLASTYYLAFSSIFTVHVMHTCEAVVC
jgi:hypothetical protein